MIKHFCDCCGKELHKDHTTVVNITPSFNSCGVQYTKELCERCYINVQKAIRDLTVSIGGKK